MTVSARRRRGDTFYHFLLNSLTNEFVPPILPVYGYGTVPMISTCNTVITIPAEIIDLDSISGLL